MARVVTRELVGVRAGFGSSTLGLNRRTYEAAGVSTPGNVPGSVKEPGVGWITGFLVASSFGGLLTLIPLRKVPHFTNRNPVLKNRLLKLKVYRDSGLGHRLQTDIPKRDCHGCSYKRVPQPSRRQECRVRVEIISLSISLSMLRSVLRS
jgi:hypothetical protein